MHLQDTAEKDAKLLFSVVDLHAITLPQEKGDLRRWRREALAMLLAVGVREERSTVFWQSEVSGWGYFSFGGGREERREKGGEVRGCALVLVKNEVMVRGWILEERGWEGE